MGEAQLPSKFDTGCSHTSRLIVKYGYESPVKELCKGMVLGIDDEVRRRPKLALGCCVSSYRRGLIS
jgi:hypothetical protein